MTVPNLLAAVCALDPAHPEKVTLIFDVPVTSVAYATGLTMRNNGSSLAIVSAAQGTDTHQVVITLGGGPAYNAVLDVSFDQSTGDWHNSSDDVASFTNYAVTNASHVGDPDSAYPLSSVITEKLTAAGGVVVGVVSVDLNSVDANLVDQYEPQIVDFGGTFGVTDDNTAGVLILQDLRPLVDSMVVKKSFYVATHPDWAAIAAAEWETTMQTRIGSALANLRTIDSTVDYGNRVIKQV